MGKWWSFLSLSPRIHDLFEFFISLMFQAVAQTPAIPPNFRFALNFFSLSLLLLVMIIPGIIYRLLLSFSPECLLPPFPSLTLMSWLYIIWGSKDWSNKPFSVSFNYHQNDPESEYHLFALCRLKGQPSSPGAGLPRGVEKIRVKHLPFERISKAMYQNQFDPSDPSVVKKE